MSYWDYLERQLLYRETESNRETCDFCGGQHF